MSASNTALARALTPPVAAPADGIQMTDEQWRNLQERGLDLTSRIWEFALTVGGMDWHYFELCPRTGCDNSIQRGNPACRTCTKEHRKSQSRTALAAWLPTAPPPSQRRERHAEQLCRVCCTPGHEHHASNGELCGECARAFNKSTFSGVDGWIEQGRPRPRKTFGRCRANTTPDEPCSRFNKTRKHGLCNTHQFQWLGSGLGWHEWLQTPHPIGQENPSHVWDLRCLSEEEFTVVCWNLNQDITDEDVLGDDTKAAVLSSSGVGVLDLNEETIVSMTRRGNVRAVLRRWARRSALHASTPESELLRDVVRLPVLGPKIYKGMPTLVQPELGWLRELHASDLRTRTAEGRRTQSLSKTARALRWWESYLTSDSTVQRLSDCPDQITSELACDAFVGWLKRRQADSDLFVALKDKNDEDSVTRREKVARHLVPSRNPGAPLRHGEYLRVTKDNFREILAEVRRVLNENRPLLRELGEHPGGWHFTPRLIPKLKGARARQREQGANRKGPPIPGVVFGQLVRAVELLAEGNARNSVQFILFAGRRPLDTAELPFDCISQRTHDYQDGSTSTYYWLRYTDRIKDAEGGHIVEIPLLARAAEAILAQQEWVRRKYPQRFKDDGSPYRSDLVLFPSPQGNRDGTVAIDSGTIQGYVRAWLGDTDDYPSFRRLENLTGQDGRSYPHEDITLYAFRRTFAQRLLDAKVPLEVVQSLMGHDDIASTQIYAQPNDHAKIAALEALDKLQTAAIDSDGNIVLLDIPRAAGHEEITTSMISWGSCAEKGRVRFGGHVCRFGGKCHNCFFLRSRVNDLPLLRLEERELTMNIELRAGVDVPAGALADEDTRSGEMKRRRVRQFIDTHEDQLCKQLSEADLERVDAMLADQEEVMRAILEPLAETSPAARIPTDKDLHHPYAEEERAIDLTDSETKPLSDNWVSFHPGTGEIL